MPASQPMVDASSDRYFDLSGLARYSGLSVRTLRKLVDPAEDHPIPSFRMREKGKILVKRSDFDAWMQRFKVERDETIDTVCDGLMEGMR